MALNTIGDRIAACLAELDWRPVHLAGRVGVSETTATRWVEGRNEPRSSQIEPIASALGVDLVWLLTGRGQPRPPSGGQASAGGGPAPPSSSEVLDAQGEAHDARLRSPAPRRRSRRTGPPAAE